LGVRRARQLEALGPDVLVEILTETIESFMDLDILEVDREAEKKDRRRIALALPAPQDEGGCE
jgi:hypothetical protein